MLCYGHDEMACHLYLILCTWDVFITCIPVTVFLSTWGVVMIGKNPRLFAHIFGDPCETTVQLLHTSHNDIVMVAKVSHTH